MKWEGNRESDNVEDRRGSGGGGGMPVFGGRSIGIGTIVIALLGGWVLGINPLTILGLLSGGGMPAQVQQAPAQRPPADDTMARFVSTVLADTEDVWQTVFREGGGRYQEPRLVLFRGATPTACGTGQAAMGPFYCPADQKVYLDMSFFQEMTQRFKAGGDFAQAYVIAHEVGHHVQTLLGVSSKMQMARQQGKRMEGDGGLLVRQELQADCLAGVWANHAQKRLNWLEPGDIENALAAANAIGDDRLQQQSQGRVVPDSFTHGTSAQRVKWFKVGFAQGNINQCDTFSAARL